MRARNAKQAFCWQQKAVLRKIREACGNVGDGASTLATYLALTEIASDKESDSFQATQEYIAGKACLGVRTVQRKIHLLVEIGLVKVTIPNMRAPGTYELLPFCHGGVTTIRNNGATLRHSRKHAPWRTLEEHKKEEPVQPGKSSPEFQSEERKAMEEHGLSLEQWAALSPTEKARRML